MHLATDVHYRADGTARAAGIGFHDWRSDRILWSGTAEVSAVKPYRPGRFFERELPCLLALLRAFGAQPDTVLVDGFVTLGAEWRDGLGAHLHRALDGAVPVIGVAKRPFSGTPDETAVYRGDSRVPLYVTSAGMEPETARRLVRDMHGAHRLPTLLRAVDRLCREDSDGG